MLKETEVYIYGCIHLLSLFGCTGTCAESATGRDVESPTLTPQEAATGCEYTADLMDDLPEVQVSPENNSRCHVNRRLLPIKGFYFTFLAGMLWNLLAKVWFRDKFHQRYGFMRLSVA